MGESTVIGLHVSGGVLRRAELSRRNERVEVLRLEVMPAPAPGSSAGPRAAGTSAASLNGSHLVASLPPTDVMSRCWPLPAAGSKLRQLVANRLEADLPVPLEKITWGYRQAQASGGTCTVLAQAAPSDRVQHYLSGLSSLGLRVHLLTTEAEALTGLYRHALRPPCVDKDLLILAAAQEWLVCAFAGGLAQAVRRIRVQAEMVEPACRECRQLIAAQFPTGGLARIRWCSARADDPVAMTLQQICGLPVEPIEVADQLIMSTGARLGGAELVAFGPAMGLALAELFDRDSVIRLAGTEAAEEAASRRPIERILARPWACAAVAGGLLVLAAGIQVGAMKWETHKMQSAAGASSATATIQKLQPEITAMNRLKRYRIDVEGICGEIGAAIKDPITLTSIQLSRERRLVIKGNSKDPKAIFTLADDLRKSPRFRSVNPERASPAQGGDFTITAELTGIQKASTPGFTRGGR